MLRVRAAVILLLAAGCSTGQSDQMSAPAAQQKAADQQAVEAGAVGSAAAEAAAAPAPPPPPPSPIEGERPAATSGPGAAEPERPEEQAAPKQSDTGGAGSKKRVLAAVVKGLEGSLTEEQVTKTVASAKERLQMCYSNAEARLEVSLQISGAGGVSHAAAIRSDPADPRRSDCAIAALAKLKFPSPGQSLKLELAIYLEPK